MAGAAVIGALRVVLGADTAAFDKGLKDAESTLGKFGANMGKAAAAIGVAMASAAAALGVSIKGAINEADNLGKMAQKIGIPVEELSALKHAADLADVSLDTLGKGVGILSKNMSAVAGGAINTSAAAFSALGISVKNSDGTLKSSSAVMTELAAKFASMQDGAGKTALAMAIFGKSGAEMIPLLNAGATGLAEMVKEANTLGIVIDSKTAKAAEGFNDNLTRLGAVKRGITIQVMAQLVPALERMSGTLIDAAKNSNIVKIASDGLARAIVFVFDNVKLLGQAFAVLIGIKVAAAVVGMAVAFVGLARALVAAGIATTLLNAAKTLTIAKVAAFGAIVLWASGNLPAFTEALKKVGDAVADMLPADTGAKTLALMQKLGVDISALTGDLKGLGEAGKSTDDALKNLKAPPIISEDGLSKARRLQEEIVKLSLQARVLRGDFNALAQGFVEAATSLKLVGENGAAIATTVSQLSPGLQLLNDALLRFRGEQLTEEMLLPWQKYELQLMRINQLADAGRISHETYGRAIRAAAESAGTSWTSAGATIATSFATIADSFGKENSAMATAAKAFAIVAAILSAYEGAAKALTLPFPANLAAAAVVLAKGFAFVAAIKSQNVPKFATGGSFKVGGVGGADSKLVQMRLSPGEMVDIRKGDQTIGVPLVNVTINGDRISRDQMRELFETLNDGMRDGYKLNLKAA